MDLSTRQMRAFIALQQLRNFTKAAAAVHLSQPAFSAMMRGLEETVGHQLILRNSRGVHLTPAGERFAELSARVVRDFDEGMHSIREALDPKNQVAIAAMVGLTYEWLPPILGELRQAIPGIQVELFAVFPRDCMTLVEAKRADFAVTALNVAPPGITTEVLWRDPFRVVCRADHPLAERPSIGLTDLVDYPFIHYAKGTAARAQIDAALSSDSMEVVCETEHIHTIKALVESGVGISVATDVNRSIFQSESLVMRPIAGSNFAREIFLAWRTDSPPKGAAERLVGLLRERVPK
ncbi:LysR family transcriptional regulator [Cupriavidus necator]|uniref:LysR family transcriptional regulator n=1 Tax=Cupriavidus necator TaxID=106590 RepID=A0A1U9UVF2_CUPNE|nr:LysR family transcriptional regulator [Cupriavidus necator]AQV96620.1 LysR family transcriptional regulator [Cupriavidus necator]